MLWCLTHKTFVWIYINAWRNRVVILFYAWFSALILSLFSCVYHRVRFWKVWFWCGFWCDFWCDFFTLFSQLFGRSTISQKGGCGFWCDFSQFFHTFFNLVPRKVWKLCENFSTFLAPFFSHQRWYTQIRAALRSL